jgi:hypothetical protein
LFLIFKHKTTLVVKTRRKYDEHKFENDVMELNLCEYKNQLLNSEIELNNPDHPSNPVMSTTTCSTDATDSFESIGKI